MTRRHRAVTIALTPAAVARYGAQEAIVLRQISAWVEWHHTAWTDEDGHQWFDASSAELADLTGLSEQTVRREVRKLVDRRLVAKRSNVTHNGQQRSSFRPLVDFDTGRPLGPNPTDSAPVDSDAPGPVDSDAPGPVDSDAPTSISKEETRDPPPAPPAGGAQQRLDGAEPDTQPARAARAKATADNDLVVGWVRALMDHWPGTSGRKGKTGPAERAMRNALAEGWTPSEIQARLQDDDVGYKAWLAAYHRIWGEAPPIKHVSSWLNELRDRRRAGTELWTEEPTIERLSDRWPAPRGRSWIDAQRRGGRRLTLEEALAAERRGELEGADHG